MPESPKARFLKTPHANTLLGIVDDPAVIAGLDAALLQMQYEAGTASDHAAASAMHFQLSGARKFRDFFLTISVIQKPQPKPRGDNLPHDL